jgi:predicted dehydrogenase
MMNRRNFISTTATAGAAVALPLASYQNVLGKNDELRIGVIGMGSKVKIGGKGKQDLRHFQKIPGVKVVAICDCDDHILSEEAEKLKSEGTPVKTYKDFRALLDDADIDAVSITTPNHSHALITVMACQAGKDVFCQKPASHSIWEGRKMVEAAQRYNRIVQVPHGARESNGIMEALAWAREGNLGKIQYIHGLNYKPRTSIGQVSRPQPVPESVDYNLWAGPAPMDPIMREYFHYDWHWFWEYGNGDLGNMGVHYMEACRIAAGANQLPAKVMSFGGRFGYEDNGETPNTLVTYFDFGGPPVVFEVRGLPKDRYFLPTEWDKSRKISMDEHYTLQIGVLVHCADGFVANNTAYDNRGRTIRVFEPEAKDDLKENFVEAVKTRDRRIQRADILDGHYASALVHMANISYRIGVESDQHEMREKAKGITGYEETCERCMDHLQALSVDFKQDPILAGPLLSFDNMAEAFTGIFSQQANALLKRDYREPFVIPERV